MVIPEVNYRKGVYLAGPGAFEVQQDLPLFNSLQDFLLILVGAVYFLGQRSFHLCRADSLCPVNPGPGIGLVKQLDDIVEPGAQFLLVFGQAGAVFDHLRHSLTIKMAQLLHVAVIGDKAGHLGHIIVIHIHLHIKINLDLEKLAKIFVVRI